MPRSVVLILVSLAAAILPACANPWARHFQAGEFTAEPLAADAAVHLEQVSFSAALTIEEREGMRLLGRVAFFDSWAHGEERAAAFARTIGATTVLWGRTDPITSTRTVTTHMPVTETTRTTGRITGPDGRTREVDLRSTTSRWEDVTSEVTETRYGHAAAFFAPAP
jgi:hypothetical protein